MCCCVVSASVYTSAGPLSLKQNGVFTLVITSGCTDSAHTAHSTHNCEAAHGEKQDVARQRFKEGFRPALSQQSGSCTQGGSVAPEVALGLMRQTTGAKVMPVVEGTMLSGGSHGTWNTPGQTGFRARALLEFRAACPKMVRSRFLCGY